MSFELCAQFCFGERPVLDFGTLGGGLGDGAWVEPELDFFAPFVVCDVGSGDAFHAEDLHFVPVTSRERIFDTREAGGRLVGDDTIWARGDGLFWFELVHLLDVNS